MEQRSFTIGDLTNAGFTLMVNGRKYRFAELITRHYGLLEDHLRRIQPKAVDLITKSVKEFGFTPEQIGAMLIIAYERDLQWPSPIDSIPAMEAIVSDAEARNDFVRMSLEAHQPGITAAEAREVAESLTRPQLRRVFAYGIDGSGSDDPGKSENNPLGESPSVSTGTPEFSAPSSNSGSAGTRSAG